MTKIVSRAYNHFEIKTDGPFPVIRKSSITDRLKNEIRYYGSLSTLAKEVRYLFPNVVDANISHFPEKEPHWIEMEYCAYPPVFGNYDNNVYDIVKQLLKALHTLHDYYEPIDQPHDSNREMYISKLATEYVAFERQVNDNGYDLELDKAISINGTLYPPLHVMTKDVFDLVEELGLLDRKVTLIHGDFCLANVLAQKFLHGYAIKLIDPRGSWGSYVYNMGDPLYDYAKLWHSLNGGYEYIINDQFSVTNSRSGPMFVNPAQASLDYDHARRIFEENLPDDITMRMIYLVEGLIYIGMCARHYDSYERQKIMYYNGIISLHKALEDSWK